MIYVNKQTAFISETTYALYAWEAAPQYNDALQDLFK